MEVDYGPALPPHLGADHHMTLDQPSSPAEEPSKKASVRPKTHSHSHIRHVVDPRSTSDQLIDVSNEPQIASSRSKKHSDKRKHKVRSRHLSSSSEEDQSSVVRHRSSKPSGVASDQDLPQFDPDPPYYREVARSDIPFQYAEEVDTFRCILSLPDPRESMPKSSISIMGLDDEKGRQELRPRGPSSILPLSSVIKYAHDFQGANLPDRIMERNSHVASLSHCWFKTKLGVQHGEMHVDRSKFAKVSLDLCSIYISVYQKPLSQSETGDYRPI